MNSGQIIKTWVTKKGNHATIRVVKQTDFEVLFKYANDLIAEDTFVMLSGKPLTLEEEQKYFNDVLQKVEVNNKIHFVVEVEGKFAGSCDVRFLEKRQSHVGEVGISLAPDFREEGIGTVCLECLIKESRSLNLKLLTLNCFEINARAIHVYEKVGFQKVGVVPEMYFYKNQYVGQVIMFLKL